MNDADAHPSEPVRPADLNGSKPAQPETAQRPPEGLWSRLKSVVGVKPASTMRDDLADVLAQEELTDRNGTQAFSPEERMYLRNILTLRETRVEDVMVPRADIDAVDDTIALGDLIRLFRKSGHSRMPVYAETLDDPRGMIHIKDLMAYLAEAADVPPDPEGKRRKKWPANLDLRRVDLAKPLKELELMRQILFVPPSMPATTLLIKMQTSRTQMALVIDEYGGTDGLVSLEDIVETVVGDIEDEHDEDEDPMFEPGGDGIWIADARVEIEDIVAEIGADFNLGELGEEVDTLGGLLFYLVDRVPVRGELISASTVPGFEFEVLDADPRRIKRVRIYRRRHAQRAQPKTAEAETAGSRRTGAGLGITRPI